ncbi:MAG: NAD(P)H-hydrate dehydratase, partial [Cyclobacteriaceae bacterium]|nr:NAD(P)H-hydrate dehydratase [Cyclobacteriaceae bacterium]
LFFVLSKDFEFNHTRIKNIECIDFSPSINFNEYDVIIDAILGIGTNRKVEGIIAKAIDAINASQAQVIAVDVPSGIILNQPAPSLAVQAQHTVTFEFPKLPFFLPDFKKFVGRWHVQSIGINRKFIEENKAEFYFLEKKDFNKHIHQRDKFSHKGIYGYALLLAGSAGKTGAAILATKACMRCGVGLLDVAIPKKVVIPLQTVVPEAMVLEDKNETHLTFLPNVSKYKAIGIGPGIGTSSETKKVVEELLLSTTQPLVLDADAINILVTIPGWKNKLRSNIILTPHPGEFERMVGEWQNDLEKLTLVKNFVAETGACLVLKGAYTLIAEPNESIYFNSTGNPGMATAGSGDVLTGILTGLLAQGFETGFAARLGVFWHGLAGDLAAQEGAEATLIASDIIQMMPKAWRLIT